MRTNGLGYKKHSIAFVLVLVLLVYAFPGVVRANKLVQISPGSTEFVMETKPPLKEYTEADKVINLAWHKQVKKDDSEDPLEIAESFGQVERTIVTYYATELVCNRTGEKISPSHIEACIETSTGYKSGYQSLEHDCVFLRPEDEWAKVTLRLAPEAWGSAGNYEGWLESRKLGNSGAIRIHATIDKYTGLSVDRTSVEVEAEHGPGSYLATESIKALVVANHPDWTLAITGDPLRYNSSSTLDEKLPRIEPSNVFIKLKGEPDNWMDLESGMTLRGSSDFKKIREFEFIIRVITELQHTAGTYSGQLHFTISE